MKNWFLYLIRCNDGSLYTGITTDVARRFREHQDNSGKGSRYLRGKAPLKLVLKKKIGSRSSALKAENKIKSMKKPQKEMIVTGRVKLEEMIGYWCPSESNDENGK